jgi:hypothetical protein
MLFKIVIVIVVGIIGGIFIPRCINRYLRYKAGTGKKVDYFSSDKCSKSWAVIQAMNKHCINYKHARVVQRQYNREQEVHIYEIEYWPQPTKV